MRKINHLKPSGLRVLLGVMILLGLFIVLSSSVSAFTNNSFNNSQTREQLNYSQTGNITRWFVIPDNVQRVTSGIINASWNTTNMTLYVGNTIAFNSSTTGLSFFNRSEYYTTGADNGGGFATTERLGQLFTVGTVGLNRNFNITNISVYGWKSGASSIVLNFTIRAVDGSNNPTGTQLATGTVGINAFPTGTTFADALPVNITLNKTAILTAGTKYALIVGENSVGGDTWSWAVDASSPTYSGGNRIISTNSGSTWSQSTTQDYLFATYGYFSAGGTQEINVVSEINSNLIPAYLVGSEYRIPFIFNSGSAGVINYTIVNISNEGFLENSQTYNATSYEGNIQGFILNISYDSSIYSSSTATLVYNNTLYPSTQTITPDGRIFVASINTPSVTSNTIFNFNWIVNLSTGSSVLTSNSTAYTQTIFSGQSIFVGTVCPAGFNASIFFNSAYEVNLSTSLVNINYNIQYGYSNMTSELIYGNITNTNNLSICINATNPFYNIGYGEIQYSEISGSYAPRRFYLFTGTRLTNQTINETLYSLENSLASSFQFTARDSALNPFSNSYLTLMRWYPSLNQYKVVEMSKTDDVGSSVMRVKSEDVDYRVGLYYQDGTLIRLLNPVRFVCLSQPCTYSISVYSTTDYTVLLSIQNNLSFNNNTNSFTYVWNDPSQATQSMNLSVYRLTGDSETFICGSSGTGFVGLITCSVGDEKGLFRAVVYRTASPAEPILSLYQTISGSVSSLGSFGLWIAFIIIGILAIGGAYISPVLALLMLGISTIPLMMLGVFSWAVAGSLIVIVLVSYFVISRRAR